MTAPYVLDQALAVDRMGTGAADMDIVPWLLAAVECERPELQRRGERNIDVVDRRPALRLIDGHRERADAVKFAGAHGDEARQILDNRADDHLLGRGLRSPVVIEPLDGEARIRDELDRLVGTGAHHEHAGRADIVLVGLSELLLEDLREVGAGNPLESRLRRLQLDGHLHVAGLRNRIDAGEVRVHL